MFALYYISISAGGGMADAYVSGTYAQKAWGFKPPPAHCYIFRYGIAR